MSPPDVPAPIPPAPTNGKAAPRPVAVLTFTLLEDGNVSVSGPIDNLPLTARIVGMGLSAVADFQTRKEGARLVQAAPAAALRILDGTK